MENETHHEPNLDLEKREDPKAAASGDALATQVEQGAKALSDEQDDHDATKTDGKADAEKNTAEQPEQSDDPGLVARMTAKGALSGF